MADLLADHHAALAARAFGARDPVGDLAVERLPLALIVLISDPRQHTLQIGLTQFSGEFDTNLHYVLAMTVVSLIPITLVFVWLQRFITTGIATTGLK